MTVSNAKRYEKGRAAKILVLSIVAIAAAVLAAGGGPGDAGIVSVIATPSDASRR